MLCKILFSILAIIAALNISVSVFLTMLRIEKAEQSKNGIFSALFFVFTILGVYAAMQLLK